jgi:hypothetical protein
MRAISIEGFEKPKTVSAGAVPMLQWLEIEDLVVDPTYQRPIVGNGRRNVDRIAREFSWSCFAPVIVSPVEGGKFAIIDGQHRTTSAAILGFEKVPCQIIIAAPDEQAAAFKAINGTITPISPMALHAAALVAKEPWAIQIAHVCACAHVELLRYPIPANKQSPGQTMAVSAITQCLRRYGETTLVTALQCVTQTKNNKPGALSARTIKAVCEVLHREPERRNAGLQLFGAFDAIDLLSIDHESIMDAAVRRMGRVQAMTERIQASLRRAFSRKVGQERPPQPEPFSDRRASSNDPSSNGPASPPP